MKTSSPRFQSCNVFALSGANRKVWRFQIKAGEPVPTEVLVLGPGKPLPPGLTAGDWRRLLQPRLNLAWLPADSVFVRAVELPAATPEEIPEMIEFQLERLSPLPPAQVVWTVEAVEGVEGGTPGSITAWVTLASRTAVEEWLARLEQEGYVADQLDLPLLRELRACRPLGDGLWLLVEETPTGRVVLVAWFLEGRWREIGLIRLAEGAAGATQLVDELTRNAWAGEFGGWLKALPPVTVQADSVVAADLEPALQNWSGQAVRTEPRVDEARVAEAAARYHLRSTGRSLIPTDVAQRRRNEFIDSLWIRSLGVAAVVYLAFVFCFMVALKVQEYRLDSVRDAGNAIAQTYTNSLQLKAQIGILQDQVALRFAALDAWRAAVEALPETLTLAQLDFTRGRALELAGTVSADNTAEVTRFNSQLKTIEANGQLLFARVDPATFFPAQGPGGSVRWSFKAELKRAETP